MKDIYITFNPLRIPKELKKHMKDELERFVTNLLTSTDLKDNLTWIKMSVPYEDIDRAVRIVKKYLGNTELHIREQGVF